MMKDLLRADLKEALKEKSFKKDVIKALLGKIQDAEIKKKTDIIEKAKKEKKEITEDMKNVTLTENEELSAIMSELNEVKETLASAEKAQRQELIEDSKTKIEIIQSYLPKPLTEDEIRDFVKNKAVELGIDMSDKNALKKVIFPALKGKADARLITKVISE